MNNRAVLVGALLLIGIGWGVTQPLAKIAVSEGYRHVGIVFWQFAIGAVLLGIVCIARGKRLPLGRAHLRTYVVIAIIGTLLPNSFSYEAARHLPSGWMSLVISAVPLFAFPIALSLGIDRFDWGRLLGILAGLTGVAVLVLPGQDALAGIAVGWVLIALIAPALYGAEGNYVAYFGTAGLDPLQVLWGASIVGTILAFPIALASGEWINPLPPYGLPDLAIFLSSTIHAVVYAGYVWLVGRAGAVFASQVSYVVTASGVLWAMLLLGERYGMTFWIALAFMALGLFLVQPKERKPVPT